ncbi:MAG: glycosyl transferase group 1 [Candidatus Acidoferrum typicum]|nr:glycosyl transferase group 1 [Candidatus Acidoferrum typicum]
MLYGSPPSSTDLPLDASNIELVPQPYWDTSLGSLPHFFGILRAYLRTCREADIIFVRGMCPYIGALYLCAFVFQRPVCHWIVGDPVALLRTSKRRGRLLDSFALLYALQDRLQTRVGRWLTDGAFLCNGRELAKAFPSPRTVATVSSAIMQREFASRIDTCDGATIRIIFVGYIRPEKGIEYLLDAVSQLLIAQSWELYIVGPSDFPVYRRRLDDLVASLGISERVFWTGYSSYGEPLFDRLRAADLLVLPSLSEGTPHVLVEARANGLPCISTTVGGVPSSVTDGYDALLVPSKNSRALANAIERVIRDGDLRRTLIRNGLNSSRSHTLERFIGVVRGQLGRNPEGAATSVPQV